MGKMDAYTESEISSLSLEWEDDDDMMNDYFIPSPPEMCVQCRVRTKCLSTIVWQTV